jgi:hypothetical protein
MVQVMSARAAGALFVLILLVVATATPAAAAAPASTGWWTSSPVPVADAPSDGLVVQGGSDVASPLAFAALLYDFASGEQPESLTLAVSASSATTPNAKLTACALTESFTPAQGGPMADAPAFDCATKATASASSDGSSYTFDVGSLAGDGTLAVAIIPTAATDRVVFDKPGPDSLQLAASSGSASANDASATDASTSASDSFSATGGSFQIPSSPATGALPPATGTEAVRASEPSTGGTTQRAASSAPISTSDNDSRLPTLLAIVLPVVAAALWLGAGRTDEAVAEA